MHESALTNIDFSEADFLIRAGALVRRGRDGLVYVGFARYAVDPRKLKKAERERLRELLASRGVEWDAK